MRPPLQQVVDAAHAEALTLHRGWLAANCQTNPDSADYWRAQTALQLFDIKYPGGLGAGTKKLAAR